MYRWSWQSLSSTAGFAPPSSSGVYAAQAVDVSKVPLFATYTVTFYDSNGAKLGQSQVINPGSPLGAAAGATVAWPTLLPDFATSVSWSSLVNGQDVAYPVNSVRIQASGLTLAGVNGEIDGFAVGKPNNTTLGQYQTTVSAGIDSFGAQTCTNCPFPALTSGASRVVELGGSQQGIGYYAVTQYND